MGTKIGSKYRKTRGQLKNYPPRGPAAARPAPGVGNSLIVHVCFCILTLFWYPFQKQFNNLKQGLYWGI